MDLRTLPRVTWAHWLRCASLPMLSVTLLSSASSCADPCIDDGLGQKFCPQDDSTDSADSVDTVDTVDTTPDSSDTNADTGCPALNVILIPQTPTMVLLVDQSSSMDANFGNGTRWTVIRDVLINPQTGVVAQFSDSIRFGLTLYTSMDGNMGGECPLLTEVDPIIDNFAAIESEFQMAVPIDETPTGESLVAVTSKLAALDVAGNKYIVLATDGEPDTCAEPNPQNGQAESVAAATAAFAQGIQTFVISVGDEVSAGHLQDMANAGAGVQPGDPDAPFYQALDEAALIAAFEEILAGVRSCQLDLMTPITPSQAQDCTMLVNGSEVGLDDPNGWQLDGDSSIELLGSACDALQQDTSSVKLECSCG